MAEKTEVEVASLPDLYKVKIPKVETEYSEEKYIHDVTMMLLLLTIHRRVCSLTGCRQIPVGW